MHSALRKAAPFEISDDDEDEDEEAEEEDETNDAQVNLKKKPAGAIVPLTAAVIAYTSSAP